MGRKNKRCERGLQKKAGLVNGRRGGLGAQASERTQTWKVVLLRGEVRGPLVAHGAEVQRGLPQLRRFVPRGRQQGLVMKSRAHCMGSEGKGADV